MADEHAGQGQEPAAGSGPAEPSPEPVEPSLSQPVAGAADSAGAQSQPQSPSPFQAPSDLPPAAEQVAPSGSESDARVAAAMQQTPADVPSQATAAPANWWEQPVPSAATPIPAPVTADVSAVPSAEEAQAEGFSFWRWLWEAAILVALAFGIAFVIKVLIIQPFYIPSGSMEPTLLPGDRVLVNKFIYRFRQPQPGDIVVFAAPRDAEQRDFIKRVIAVEGQTVEVKDGKVYVDGKLREEPYLASSQDHSSFGPITLADNTVFVMGDNRTNSSDSRVFGPFNRDRILGEAFVVYWPLSRIRVL